MAEVSILVSVSDQYMNQLPEIGRLLQAQGMQVRQILDQVGIITGSIESDKINSLHEVNGINHIQQEEEFTI